MTSSTKRRFLPRLACLGIAAATVAAFAAGEPSAGEREGEPLAARSHDFRAAYEAYLAASSDGRHGEAATHAEQAKRLGETLFAGDGRRLATLAYNHGHALSKASRYGDAYDVLKDARKLMRDAHGEDAPELAQVEIALVTAAPLSAVRKHLRRAERIARLHDLDESASIAHAQLMVGMRIGGRQGLRLLEEATSAFEGLGDADGLALGNFWQGKIRAKHGWGDAAGHFEATLVHAQRAGADLPTRQSLVLMAHKSLVAVLEESGLRDEATKHCLAIGRLTSSGGTSGLQALYKKALTYPANAWRQRIEGWVQMEFDVDESGFVRDAKVVESDGGVGFETAALEAVRAFRYAPRFVDGEAVASPGVRNLIKFEIKEG